MPVTRSQSKTKVAKDPPPTLTKTTRKAKPKTRIKEEFLVNASPAKPPPKLIAKPPLPTISVTTPTPKKPQQNQRNQLMSPPPSAHALVGGQKNTTNTPNKPSWNAHFGKPKVGLGLGLGIGVLGSPNPNLLAVPGTSTPGKNTPQKLLHKASTSKIPATTKICSGIGTGSGFGTPSKLAPVGIGSAKPSPFKLQIPTTNKSTLKPPEPQVGNRLHLHDPKTAPTPSTETEVVGDESHAHGLGHGIQNESETESRTTISPKNQHHSKPITSLKLKMSTSSTISSKSSHKENHEVVGGIQNESRPAISPKNQHQLGPITPLKLKMSSSSSTSSRMSSKSRHKDKDAAGGIQNESRTASSPKNQPKPITPLKLKISTSSSTSSTKSSISKPSFSAVRALFSPPAPSNPGSILQFQSPSSSVSNTTTPSESGFFKNPKSKTSDNNLFLVPRPPVCRLKLKKPAASATTTTPKTPTHVTVPETEDFAKIQKLLIRANFVKAVEGMRTKAVGLIYATQNDMQKEQLEFQKTIENFYKDLVCESNSVSPDDVDSLSSDKENIPNENCAQQVLNTSTRLELLNEINSVNIDIEPPKEVIISNVEMPKENETKINKPKEIREKITNMEEVEDKPSENEIKTHNELKVNVETEKSKVKKIKYFEDPEDIDFGPKNKKIKTVAPESLPKPIEVRPREIDTKNDINIEMPKLGETTTKTSFTIISAPSIKPKPTCDTSSAPIESEFQSLQIGDSAAQSFPVALDSQTESEKSKPKLHTFPLNQLQLRFLKIIN